MKINFTSSSAVLLLLLLLTGCDTKGTGGEKKVPVDYAISLKHGDDGWRYELKKRKDRYISNAHIAVDSASGMALRVLPQFHDLANVELQKYLNDKMDSIAEVFSVDKGTHCYYELKYMDDTLLSFILTRYTKPVKWSCQFYNYNLVTGKKLYIDDFFQEISFRDSLVRYAKMFVGPANTLPGDDTLQAAWRETVKRARRKIVPGTFDNFSFTEQQFQFYLCTDCSADEDRNTFNFEIYYTSPKMRRMLNPDGTGKHLLVFGEVMNEK